jgi:hypothetical protein
MNLPGTSTQMRQPAIPDLDLSLEETTQIKDNVNFTLRFEPCALKLT